MLFFIQPQKARGGADETAIESASRQFFPPAAFERLENLVLMRAAARKLHREGETSADIALQYRQCSKKKGSHS